MVAYQLLTGERPFAEGRTDTQVAAALPAGVPADLAAVVARAMRPAPAERYSNADALLAALQGASDAPPAPVPPDDDRTVLYPVAAGGVASAPPARRRGRAWLVALPLLAGAAGVWAITEARGGGPGSSGADSVRLDTAPAGTTGEADVEAASPRPAGAGDPVPAGPDPAPPTTDPGLIIVQPTDPSPLLRGTSVLMRSV